MGRGAGPVSRARYWIHTSLAAGLSPPLAIPGLPGIAQACGEELEVGVVQTAPSRAIRHHPHP